MTISNAINNALSGLRANSRLAEVTSGNLANALTPGFGRQTVDLTAAVTGGQGTGVQIEGVERALDPELSAARRLADGDLAQQSARFDGLRALERAIGGAEAPDGLFDRVRRFETALRALAETPDRASRQQAAVEAARDLAFKFNQISTETTRMRQAADDDIARQVEIVNTSLKKIAKLNRQIQIFEASGRDTASLIDERERLIDRVAQIVPIRETRFDDGTVELRTAEGITLVGLRAQALEFNPTPVMTPDMDFAAGVGPLGGLSLSGVDITPGGPGPQAVRGGAIAGAFAARDAIGSEFRDRVDSLAADLIERFADPAVDPTLAPGDPGLFTDAGGPFDMADTVGIAGRIELNALADPQAGGDATRLRDGLNATTPGPVANATLPRALLDTLTAPRDASATPGLAGDLSFSDRTAGVIELTATERVSLEAEVSALGATREALAAEEAEQIGVDTDAELQKLIQIEQAFAANAQVIETASRMLDELRRF